MVIFLDAVGTLFGIRGSVGKVYAQIALEFGVEADPLALNRAFLQTFKVVPKMAFPDVLSAEIPNYERQWWRSLALAVFTQLELIDQFSDFEAFFVRLYDYFAQPDPWFVYPDVFEALDYWQSQEIEMGIISNFDSRIYSVLQALTLDKYFTSVTISTEVGAAKPDIQIFSCALNKHNCKDTDKLAWHIGDSLNEDYQGAIATDGIRGFWLNREPDFKPSDLEITLSLSSVQVIASLTKLLSPEYKKLLN